MRDEKQPVDALMDEHRILGESRMIRDPDPTKITRDQAQAVIDAIGGYIARTGASQTFVAHQIGWTGPVLSEVFKHKYNGDWQQVILDLDRWLEDEVKREQNPKPTAFVRTRVAEDIMLVADMAVLQKGIGLVYGESGMGKSLTLEAIAAEKPGSIRVSIETIASSAAGVIEAIARAMRLIRSARQVVSSRHALTLIKKELVGTPRLVIIDEIHKLCEQADDKALHVLRDLHDATGCPMLWCGTTDLVQWIDQRQATRVTKEPLAQISRRIVMALDLKARTVGPDGKKGEPLYTVEEIRKVFARSKMRLAPDAARYLTELANLPECGHLGTCKNVVVMALRINERNSDVLTADMLRGAHSLMCNQWSRKRLEETRRQWMEKVG